MVDVNVQHDVSMIDVILEKDNILMKEIVIKGSSVVRKDDKLLIYPNSKFLRQSNSSYDLLYRLMIPNLQVDRIDKTIKIMGESVTLYLDGRRINEQEMKHINPKEIEAIEYHDVPSGKYVNDIAVINFITREKENGGYVFLSADQKIGYFQGDYNATAKFIDKQMNYTLFLGKTINDYEGVDNETQERFIFSDNNECVRNLKTIENENRSNNQYIQLNVTKTRGSNYTVTGIASLLYNDSPNNEHRSLLEYIGSNEKCENVKDISNNNLKATLGFHGHFLFKKSHSLNVATEAVYAHSKYKYNYREHNFFTYTSSRENYFYFQGSLNYTITFDKKKSLTVQAYHILNRTSINYVKEEAFKQDFWNRETILFGEYNQKIGKFSLRLGPGISYNRYRLNEEEKVNTFSPRLRSRLIYRPSKTQQVQLRFHIGNGQQRIEALNKVEQRMDSLQIRRGSLKQKIPGLTSLILAYSSQKKNLNIGMQVWYDKISHVPGEDFYVEGNKLIRSYRSDDNRQSLFTQLSVALSLSDNFRIKAEGEWNYIEHEVRQEKSRVINLNYWSGNLQTDCYCKNVSFGFFVRSKRNNFEFNMMSITSPARYGGYISWNYKGWNIEGGVTNPFGRKTKIRTMMDREVYKYENVAISQLYQANAYVSCSYIFNWGKKIAREKSNIVKNVNSAILKPE